MADAARASLVVIAPDVAATAVIAIVRNVPAGVVAFEEPGSARNPALPLHANSPRGANVAARAAVVRIRQDILLATVGGIEVAIGKAGLAGPHRASAGLAGCRSVRVGALVVANAAMGAIRREIRLAAGHRIAIAITESDVALDELTGSVDTGAYPVREGASIAAGTAVRDVGA